MKKIAKLYKWEFINELYASIYFAAMLSIYCVEVLLHGERNVDIFVMLQMLLVCYVIALVQWRIFSDGTGYLGKDQVLRTIAWYSVSTLLVIAACFSWNWFKDLQPWAAWVFIGSMVFCFFFIWIGIRVSNQLDTKHLNHLLSHYQEASQIEQGSEIDE